MAANFIPQAGATLEIRCFCQLGNQGSVNVRHYYVSLKNGTGATLQEICDTLSPRFHGAWTPAMNSKARYQGVGARQILPLPATSEALSGTNAGPGVGTGIALPAQVCGLVSLRTNVGGRQGRGRSYIPFPSQMNQTDEFTPNAAYLTALTTIGDFLIANQICGTAPNQTTLVPVLFNRKTSVFSYLSNYRLPPRWATQRRRGAFGRPNESPV